MTLLRLKRFADRTLSITVLAALAAAPGLSADAISLTGAGATFPAPIYQKWFSDYKSIGNVEINYQPIGSGGGIKNVTEGTVDFGASDAPLSDEQLKNFKDKNGHSVLLFPTVLGAAVPSYNIPNVTAELNFTPQALAGIFMGTIKKWNDPAIAGANKGVNLPDLDIVVVHRAEASGTTYCWTDYLSKVSPEWKSKVGKNASVDWPVGLGAKGNDGVSGILKQQTGAVGYIELVYAVKNHLAYGKVQNQAKEFVKADLQSVTAAAASMKEMPADFRVSITDAPGKGAYPISTFTWLLVPDTFKDPQKGNAMKGFMKWAITQGQDQVEGLDYARLPKSVVVKEEKQLAAIK